VFWVDVVHEVAMCHAVTEVSKYMGGTSGEVTNNIRPLVVKLWVRSSCHLFVHQTPIACAGLFMKLDSFTC
jgi:hypothetical protein